MKKIILILCMMLLCACGKEIEEKKEVAKVNRITCNEVNDLVSEGAIVVDVRTPGEYETDHIENAINIDSNEITVKGKPSIANRRKYKRKNVNNTCSYVIGTKKGTGTMVNISAGGFAFTCVDKLDFGQLIRVKVNNLSVVKDEELVGCIIRTTKDKTGYSYGIRMLDDNEEINKFVIGV